MKWRTMTGEVQHIGEYSEGHLLKLAKKLTEEKTAKTKIFDREAEARVPTFDKSGKSAYLQYSIVVLCESYLISLVCSNFAM